MAGRPVDYNQTLNSKKIYKDFNTSLPWDLGYRTVTGVYKISDNAEPAVPRTNNATEHQVQRNEAVIIGHTLEEKGLLRLLFGNARCHCPVGEVGGRARGRGGI